MPPYWGIERKTIMDFYSSIFDGRLESEVGRMVIAYDVPIVVIVGNIARLKIARPDKWNYVMSNIREIIAKYKIPVLSLPEDKDLARFATSLYNHVDEINEDVSYRKEIMPVDKSLPPTTRMLMQVPNIGKVTAEKISEEYTISQLVDAIRNNESLPLKGHKLESLKKVLFGD